jgi:hypothetical protein
MAIQATATKLARLVYRLLRYGLLTVFSTCTSFRGISRLWQIVGNFVSKADLH